MPHSVVDTFLIRSVKCGFCPEFIDAVNKYDQRLLIQNIFNNPHRVLCELLPPLSVASWNFKLRQMAHRRELPCRAVSLFQVYHCPEWCPL